MKNFIEITAFSSKFLIAVHSISSIMDAAPHGSVITLTVPIHGVGDSLDTDLSFAEVKALIEQAQQA